MVGSKVKIGEKDGDKGSTGMLEVGRTRKKVKIEGHGRAPWHRVVLPNF